MTLIKAEKTEKSAFFLEFSVDKETFEKAVNKVYRKQVSSINIPGFRKGKAPRAVVERMYGKGVFYEDAANELLPDAYEAALKEAGVNPVGRAEFDITSIDENGIVFTATVPVKPAVTVEGYKSINAAAQMEDETSIRAFYKKLISLRKEMELISEGKIEFLMKEHPTVLAYRRYTDNQEMLVLCNLTGEETAIEMPAGWENAQVLIANDSCDVTTGKLNPYTCIALLK